MNALRKISIVLALLALLTAPACNTKKDCRGHTKHRLANGIWM